MMQAPSSSSYSSSLSSPSSVSPGHPCHISPPMPPGWQECVSKSTGRTYFWNQHTKKSQWDRPTKSAVPQKLSPVEDNSLTSWPQSKNVRDQTVSSITAAENAKNAREAPSSSEDSKENKLHLLNDYLKKIQSGEATVEELASKFDNRIKPVSATDADTDADVKEAIHGGFVNGNRDGKVDSVEENLVNGSESSSQPHSSSISSHPQPSTVSSSPSRQPLTRQVSEESSKVIRQFSDSSQGTSVSVDNTPLPSRRAVLGSTGWSSASAATAGGPANRLIARLRGRALKSVTPHQFFSNPSLHSVEETDIDTGQKTTKVLFGETNLDEVYKEKVLKAKSMMNLTPTSAGGASSAPAFGAGRCFKAKSLDPVFKESVPLSRLNGFSQDQDDDSTLSDHERRFKKSLQNLHVPDWFSNSRFYRNHPADVTRGGNGKSSSSSSSTFLTPNTPVANRPPQQRKNTSGVGGRNASTLPANSAPPPMTMTPNLTTSAAAATPAAAQSATANHRPDLTKSKSTDSHDTVPSDWTSKPSSSCGAAAAAADSLTSPLPASTSSSNPLSPMSPIFANLKAGSPYTRHRGILSRDLSGDQTTSCSEAEEMNGSAGANDKCPGDASSAFSNSDSCAPPSRIAEAHPQPNSRTNVKTMHITGV